MPRMCAAVLLAAAHTHAHSGGATAGGGGGGAVTLSCPGGYQVVGYNLRCGTLVDQIQLICRN